MLSDVPLFLIAGPVILGCATLLVLREHQRLVRRWILLVGAGCHLAGTIALHVVPLPLRVHDFISVDALGLLVLTIVSGLTFLVACYSFGYFHKEPLPDQGKGVSRLYVPCMLFFLAAMTLSTVAAHLGLLWVAIEATTLASAPLIYYHHTARSLEATWKYLLICSVGIALALLGIFFFGAASKTLGLDLFIAQLTARAAGLNDQWLRIGFLLMVVGFGTKMGLAPFHNWLPDAHSEAPSPVSALLSGALLNCAFLGILRGYQICGAAGLAPFANTLLVTLGLVSLLVAAIFLTAQRDFKRLLAYSSIEHMGILALGLGVGSGVGAMAHMVNHSLTKGLLFLVAGHLVLAYRTKKVAEVHGLLKTLPVSGTLFLLGGLAILGVPPFAPFLSELLILRDGLLHGHLFAMIGYLALLGIIFAAVSRRLFGMIGGGSQCSPHLVGVGDPDTWGGRAADPGHQRCGTGGRQGVTIAVGRYPLLVLPPAVLAIGVVGLGCWWPAPFVAFLRAAALVVGVVP